MKDIDAVNSMPNDFQWNNNMSLSVEQLIKQYGLTIDDIKMFPLVERHRWGVSGYVNESEDDTEDPQVRLEIWYLNSVEKEMTMSIRGLLHRFRIREEKNGRPERVYGFNQEQDMMELDQFFSRLLI